MNFLSSTSAIAAAGLAVGLGHQAQASWVSRRHHKGWQVHQVEAESANVLTCYRRQGKPGAPELFFEAGLMNTSTAWLLTADSLGRDYTITVYDRAGYRRSLRRVIEPYTLAESASDAADVVRTLRSPNSATYLVGHSIGGYLSHRTAALVGDLDAVIALDPMHPAELIASPQQRNGAKATDLTLRTGPTTIAVGGGLLMDKAGILKSAVGNRHKPQLATELSAATTWFAASREWKFAYAWMLDGAATLSAIDCPVHVIGASDTVSKSSEQRELFDDYVTSGSTPGNVQIVDDADHLGVVHSPAQVQRVAAALRNFAPGLELERPMTRARQQEVHS